MPFKIELCFVNNNESASTTTCTDYCVVFGNALVVYKFIAYCLIKHLWYTDLLRVVWRSNCNTQILCVLFGNAFVVVGTVTIIGSEKSRISFVMVNARWSVTKVSLAIERR
jgi:hypothetical protein